MNEQEKMILDYLEKAYTGANTMDDTDCMTRIARAIAAFKLDTDKDCIIQNTEEMSITHD